MRYLGLGMLLFIALVAIAAADGISATRPANAVSAAATTATSQASATDSGPGFAICGQSGTWQRPTEHAQRAHLGSDARYNGLWTDDGSPAAEEFRSPAVLYDGGSTSALASLVELTGLWTAWPAKMCATQQPQVFLFGYEPVRYDASSPAGAELQVRPAAGYRVVVLTGPIRPHIRVMGERSLADLIVPAGLVTPLS